ncbi:putative tetratricopeptide-like helical domain, zinc-finger domain-containing protein [Lupinus albus]|uniref:Putative tetratricopeptide-like helical domain, zinc-finger domain-containing protein n=1 Tax=Lupinus albus TaxID=3870 RepID=A0A6A4QQ44_LUPAL|nr:putative tetratricopeptide-like helical domain, zinc-finger domain-containing protein [Lupinus albus]
MEELIDKELEEAQEHRHKCEIEERNALKVYLKSQRSLLEANARCMNLYHKRELYATKLQSLILNNSSFSWSSEQHQHLEMGLDYLPRHGYEMPTSSCQRQAEYNDTNNPSFDSNNQGINNGRSNAFYHPMNGANLGSEPFIEPGASTSEPLPQRGNTADGGYSPSGELDTSGNENEEMSPDGHVSTHLGVENHRNKDTMVKLMDIDTASNTKHSTDTPQDPLVLEATLRSELFARLGTRAMNRKTPCNNTEPSVELGAENEVGSGKSQVHYCVFPLSAAEDDDLKGIERHENSICLYSNETQTQHNVGENSLNSNYSAASGDQGGFPRQSHYSTNTMNISSLIFRSAFSHLKEMSPFNSNQFLSKNIFIRANDGENENATCLTSDETKWNNMLANSMPVTVGNLLSEESSYSCSPAVDPFWPLCIFELRGKCNNDECPWQHVKDYGDGNVCKPQRTDSNNPDRRGRLQMHQQNSNGVTKLPKCHKATILPTYIVDLDTLKGDQFGYKPVVAHGNAQGWQKCFSITLATSNLLQNGLPTDGPLLDGGAERIEVHTAWSKHLSSFQWRSGAGDQIKQAIGDGEQAVEMALLILNQETNILQGVRKALSVLSKALEADPTSVVLWVVYLLICSANLKPNEKDDMFFFAVKNCEVSYVLWLMYINNQKRIDDRLDAYDAALLVLYQHLSASPKDRMYESACILDLFLQMMACLCMSGNVEKAIEMSHGVFASTTKSDEPHTHHLPLSDILNCLTISDKCVFWICCVYFVIYRKLPDAVVHKFECEKDLLDIEWPFVSLSEDDKEMAAKLVETAVESVDSYVYNEPVKSEVDLRSAQLFALNYIRCMVALDNIDCLRNLLDKYVKLYPSCLELVLVSARVTKQEIGVDSFMGFEEAINMWPKEVPGIQCIWNQYIENTIQNQRIDFAKEITAHWFRTVWQMQDIPNVRMGGTAGGNFCGSLGLNSKSVPETSTPDLNQIDAVFGFLNLSLYNIFQNDETEACVAVDKARKAAMFGGLEQCLTKHIMFLLCDALSLKEGSTNAAMKKVLEGYMDCSSQASLVPKVLTRKFLENIKRPRVQNLISKILSRVSFDCSLLNMILQSWYGSSLLPQTGSDPKHLVDLVEAIMKVVPYNFQLAINVCKLLSKSYNSSDLHSAGLWFWACSTLVNAILDAIPIPPEFIWVEAGGFLQNAMGIEAISERFYKRALSVYPFSIMLWTCFYKLHKTIGDAKDVIEAAKERGIDLVTDPVSGC